MRLRGLGMALTNYKLGELVELVSNTNSENKYGPDDVRGMTITKEIIPTKADVMETDLSKFLVVEPGEFIYNPRTHGKKIGFGYNNTSDTFIISWNNIAFRVKPSMKDVVLADYLFLHFKRDEWDREACFQSWGSSTEVFSWETLCDMSVDLPSLKVQQKYVGVYNAMVANQKSYEHGLEDLKLAMDSFYDKLKSCRTKKIAEIIKTRSNKNTDFSVPFSQLRGINESGEFTTTRDSIRADDIDKYLIVDNETYAVNFMCLGNFGKFYLAYNDFGEKYLVSPACNIFQLIDQSIDPYYFTYVLQRSEFQRKCVFYGDGNTRGGINIADFSNIEIPVPTKEEQTIISNLYRSFENRRKLNDKLKNQLKDICPILIKGSVEEAKQEE